MKYFIVAFILAVIGFKAYDDWDHQRTYQYLGGNDWLVSECNFHHPDNIFYKHGK